MGKDAMGRPDVRTEWIVPFWRRVRITKHARDCWPWRGAINHSGYGVVSIGGRSMGAHRFAFIEANRRDPGKLWVLHSCDTPSCCNPRHLRLGTAKDNSKDAHMIGRVLRLLGAS